MKSVSLLVATLLLTPVLAVSQARPVAAAEDPAVLGAKILKKADELASAFPNQTYVARMKVKKGGEVKKTLAFQMVMKDLEKQFITFTEPGDVAGMKILMTDSDSIFMYSPEFQKVRKIAAHAQNQGFLGSEFTPEDMKLAKLSTLFDAEFAGKEGTETTLILRPKTPEASSYAMLKIVIDSKVGGITTITYFDGSGEPVRKQIRDEWQKHKGAHFPTRIVMKNLKTGDETVIHLSEIDVDTVISDDIFSRRTLMRG